MAPDEPILELHVRLTLASVTQFRAVARRPAVRLVSWKADEKGRVVADALVSIAEADALRDSGHDLTVLAKLNQPEDLKREVSQTNRYADRLARLKRRRKR